MSQGLWDWQDQDATRLRRDGKRELARLWERFEVDGSFLEGAAELARAEDEPVWEMFYLHWFVQQGLFRENADLQRLQPAVERLAELAQSAHCEHCPQRFCARESVSNFQLAADPPGFAPAVLKMARAMLEQVPTDLECRGCFELLEAGSLIEMARLDEASRALDRVAGTADDDNLAILVLLFKASVAHQLRDLETLTRLLEQARALLEGGAGVNQDNRWFLGEVEVRRALLDGDPDHAEELCRDSPDGPPPLSAEAMRIAIAMAEAYSERGLWKEAQRHAEKALIAARRRGMVRYAAEAALWAAEACHETGESDRQEGYATELSMLLGQLQSRDLDQRAAAVGASVDDGSG